MSSPNSVITRSDRTRSGFLPTSALQRIKGCLISRGFVLLPSDTCYSIAALIIDKNVKKNVNRLLNRSEDPISLSFSNIDRVEKFVHLNPVSAILLESFTPGPITVVCNSKPEVPVEITSQVLGTNDRTIGVRIPDSQIEREISNCTRYPITSVAVRDPVTKEVVTSFQQAIEIVREGMERLENMFVWEAAIEGDGFYSTHSTVIHVNSDTGELNLIREGDIPFEAIQSTSKNVPFWSIEDWT